MNIKSLIWITVMTIFISLLIEAGIILILAILAQECWNMFCGYINLPAISYWQMFGLMMFICFIACPLNTKFKTE